MHREATGTCMQTRVHTCVLMIPMHTHAQRTHMQILIHAHRHTQSCAQVQDHVYVRGPAMLFVDLLYFPPGCQAGAVVLRGALWKPTSVICFSPFPPVTLTLALTPCTTLKGIFADGTNEN